MVAIMTLLTVAEYLRRYRCYRVAANIEATEPSVPSGEIEVITWKVLRSLHDLVDRYGVSVVQMITDMFHLSKSQNNAVYSLV
jgi:hypothetical protein